MTPGVGKQQPWATRPGSPSMRGWWYYGMTASGGRMNQGTLDAPGEGSPSRSPVHALRQLEPGAM